MANKEAFERAFSPLHASPDTLREVQKKMEHTKHNRHLTRAAVIGIAAALTLSAAFAAAKIMGGTLRRADNVGGDIVSAFDDGSISTQKAVVYDSSGNQIDLPDMVREHTDADTVARLVGDYLYDVEGTLTAGDYTLTLDSFLMDEQGMGVLTCRLENPNGIAYQDEGYGKIGLPVGLMLWQDAEKKSHMDAEVYLDQAQSTDTCLQLVVYFGSFRVYHTGEPVYLSLNEIKENAVWQMLEIQPQAYVPTVTLSADGHAVTVSALGMTVENPVADELTVRELVLHFADGTDYAVESERLHQMNRLVSYWQGDGTGFPAVCAVFNRLVDIEGITSVTMEGRYLPEGGEHVTVALEYRS